MQIWGKAGYPTFDLAGLSNEPAKRGGRADGLEILSSGFFTYREAAANAKQKTAWKGESGGLFSGRFDFCGYLSSVIV
ncbi:hypothetical protein HER10_EVM0002262 [Colletotrichum scovillei]|uniref:uncharacterized protein n=1 Tax=Colletotrichum scovillei TaxID=1209932 RepID=UPI0015C3D3AC|nr:uncharacterized protein HER10_EVM0002262 [Colletotrichum scovillei]KAF4785065.1 hypothetical protein HER10_EVM0002262 [Colletotrichum scovillei]